MGGYCLVMLSLEDEIKDIKNKSEEYKKVFNKNHITEENSFDHKDINYYSSTPKAKVVKKKKLNTIIAKNTFLIARYVIINVRQK